MSAQPITGYDFHVAFYRETAAYLAGFGGRQFMSLMFESPSPVRPPRLAVEVRRHRPAGDRVWDGFKVRTER